MPRPLVLRSIEGSDQRAGNGLISEEISDIITKIWIVALILNDEGFLLCLMQNIFENIFKK
jgi:hypothetical protein